MPVLDKIRWTSAEWRAVCATFRVFEKQLDSRALSYVSVPGISAASGVSSTTARRALNRLVEAGVLCGVGLGSVMYRPMFAGRRRQ